METQGESPQRYSFASEMTRSGKEGIVSHLTESNTLCYTYSVKSICVVYTEREDASRLATPKERRIYYGDDENDYL